MKRSLTISATTLLVVAPSFAAAQSGPSSPPPPPPARDGGPELTSLRLMLEKGIISQAEYDSAVRDMVETAGSQTTGDKTTLVVGKWFWTLYGFAQADYIVDSTQSFSDIPGAGLVARPDTYAGGNPRTQFSVRNSRLGLRFAAPEYRSVRASALFESDFAATAMPVGSQPGGQTENNFFTNPTMRLRQFYLKVENPVIDLLFGQTWHIFGWQTAYHANTDQAQGVPGEIYAWTPQLRLSKTFRNDAVTFDVAVAAMRPPQRDSAIPEGEAGLHLAVNKWTATQTLEATGTKVSPLSVAVTGDVRQYQVQQLSAKPTNSNGKTTSAIAFDAFVPILPGSDMNKGNSLSLLGEFVYGYGITDMFTGLQSGVTWPTLPNPARTGPAPVFSPDVDPGLVMYGNNGLLHGVQWTVFRGGVSYFLPKLDGKAWITLNYSRTSSDNVRNAFGPKDATLDHLDWYDVDVMGDITPAVRLGIEYSNYTTTYVDGVTATDHRVTASAFYLF